MCGIVGYIRGASKKTKSQPTHQNANSDNIHIIYSGEVMLFFYLIYSLNFSIVADTKFIISKNSF